MFAPRIALDVYGGATDVAAHYYWGSDYFRSLKSGIALPSWASSMYGGLGSPILFSYPPLFYFTASLLTFITGDFYLSMMLVLALANFASGVISFKLLDRLGLTKAAFLAAFLIQTCPLVLVMTTAFNAWPTYFALPAMIWFLKISIEMEANRILNPWVSLSAAVLVLSHALHAFNVFTCIGVAFVFVAIANTRRNSVNRPTLMHEFRRLFSWSLSTILGIAITAFYLLPATIALKHFLPGTLDIAVPWYKLFLLSPVTALVHGLAWPNVQIVLPSIVASYLIVAIICARLPSINSPKTTQGDLARIRLVLLVASLVAAFLMSELSWLVWHYVAMIRGNQLPARFLSIAHFIAVFAFLVYWYTSGNALWKSSAVLATAALVPTILTIALTLQFFLKDARPRNQFLDLPISVRKLDEAGFGQATYFADGWRDYLTNGGLHGECVKRDIKCRTLLSEPHKKAWSATGSIHIPDLQLPLFWFPNWKLTINGTPVTPGVSRATGLMTVALARGNHEIIATWDHGVPRRIGIAITVAAVLALVFSFVSEYHSTRQSQR